MGQNETIIIITIIIIITTMAVMVIMVTKGHLYDTFSKHVWPP